MPHEHQRQLERKRGFSPQFWQLFSLALLALLINTSAFAQESLPSDQTPYSLAPKAEIMPSPTYHLAYQAGQRGEDFWLSVNQTSVQFFATMQEIQSLVESGQSSLPFLTEAAFTFNLTEQEIIALISGHAQGYWHSDTSSSQIKRDFTQAQASIIFPNPVTLADSCGEHADACVITVLNPDQSLRRVRALPSSTSVGDINHETGHLEWPMFLPPVFQNTRFNWQHTGAGTITQVNTNTRSFILIGNENNAALAAFDLRKINEVMAELFAHGPLVAAGMTDYSTFYGSHPPFLEFEKQIHAELAADAELRATFDRAAQQYDLQTLIVSLGRAALRVDPNFVQAIYDHPDQRRYSHQSIINPEHQRALSDIPAELAAGVLLLNELLEGTRFIYDNTFDETVPPDILPVRLVSGELSFYYQTMPPLLPQPFIDALLFSDF